MKKIIIILLVYFVSTSSVFALSKTKGKFRIGFLYYFDNIDDLVSLYPDKEIIDVSDFNELTKPEDEQDPNANPANAPINNSLLTFEDEDSARRYIGDFSYLTFRSYLHAEKIEKTNINFHFDFHGKEHLQNPIIDYLGAKKTIIKVNELNLEYNNDYAPIRMQFGRIPLANLGFNLIDGVQLEYKVEKNIHIGVFSGEKPDPITYYFTDDLSSHGMYLNYSRPQFNFENGFIFDLFEFNKLDRAVYFNYFHIKPIDVLDISAYSTFNIEEAYFEYVYGTIATRPFFFMQSALSLLHYRNVLLQESGVLDLYFENNEELENIYNQKSVNELRLTQEFMPNDTFAIYGVFDIGHSEFSDKNKIGYSVGVRTQRLEPLFINTTTGYQDMYNYFSHDQLFSVDLSRYFLNDKLYILTGLDVEINERDLLYLIDLEDTTVTAEDTDLNFTVNFELSYNFYDNYSLDLMYNRRTATEFINQFDLPDTVSRFNLDENTFYIQLSYRFSHTY